MRGHSVGHGNNSFAQKCGSTRNGVYMYESTWHVLVNATITWGASIALHRHVMRKHHCAGDIIKNGSP